MDAKMAMDVAEQKKPVMNILQECGDKQDELLTRFVLETRLEEVRSELKNSNFSLYKLEDKYIAKPNQDKDNWKAEVVRIIHKFTRNYDVINLPATDYVSGRLRDCNDIKITKAGDRLEVCGDKLMIAKLLEDSKDNSWDQIELVEVPLTDKEQAILYLYDLWNCPFFIQNEICVEKKTSYNATVKVYTSADEKAKRQNEIKHEIGKTKVFETTEKLNDKVAELVKNPVTQAKIDKKLNYLRSSQNCAWYVGEQTSTLSVFGKSQQAADDSYKKFMSFIMQASVQVPSRFTSTGQVSDVIDSINVKFLGSAIVCLNSKLNCIDYVCTEDVKRSVETDIKQFLFSTGTVRISSHIDFCKIIFENLKASIESKLLVEVEAVDEASLYKWVIKGFPDDVDKAYGELHNTVMVICSKNKTFILDGKIETEQEKVDKCFKEMNCLFKVEEIKWASDGIKLQEEALYHEWVIPSLNTLRLINSDQTSWLAHKSKAVKMETADQSNKEFNEDLSSATIFLPKWERGEIKEKEKLFSILTHFFTQSSCARSTKDPLVFEMQATADWPWEKVLKLLLMTLNSQQGVSPVYICEADRRMFEKGSTIIQTFIQQQCLHPGIDINVVSGELTKQRTDAVVNSTASDLNLTKGAVSSSILKSAGMGIQNECLHFMSNRQNRHLNADEVVVTSAGNMSSCRHVFHGALSAWIKQRLPEFVYNCLHQADLLQLRSIAFPSLGTGILNYPPDQVARIMFETIRQYGLHRQIKYLREVMLVIYPKDTRSLMAFQKVDGLFKAGCPRKDNLVKCPNPLKIKVTLTGKDPDTVTKAFGALENMLTQKEYLSKPTTKPNSADDEPLMEWETSGGEDAVDRKDSTSLNSNVEQFKSERVESDGTESCDFIKFGIKDGNGHIYKTLVETLKKYNIDETILVWSPLYPQEARIKLTDDNDRIKACIMLEKEAKYERQQYNGDAVINIRFKLSDRACQHLRENTDQKTDLERQSGVDVLPECKVITGDLYSISIAREILSWWISNQPCDSRFHFLKTSPENALNDDNGEKRMNVKTQEITVPSWDHTIDSNKEDVSRNTGARPKQHVTSVSKQSSLGKDRTSPTGRLKQDADDKDEDEDEKDEVYVDIGDVSGQDSDSANHPLQFPNLDDTYMIPTKDNISVYIYQGDLCYLNAKCIVNSTNELMNSESGLCKVVMQKAGPLVQQKCINEIRKNGKLQRGSMFSTQAGNLHHYQRIIHVCAPVWAERESKEMFEKSLIDIVDSALVTADDLKLESIAFPAIGSGGRGVLKKVCFVAFARAVKSYSGRYGQSSRIKQIHFVDQQSEVVDSLKTAFVHVLLENDAQRELMFTKIPAKIRNTFDFPTVPLCAKATMNIYNKQTLPNKVKLELCDGSLLSALTHKHSIDTPFADSGLVLPICADRKHEGCAMGLCRQRSTEEFERFLDSLQKQKRKAGDVIEMVHDKNIKFAYIFSPVMPTIDKKAQKMDKKFTKSFATSCENVLITVDKKGVKHIVFPVLTLDMYPTEDALFTTQNLKTMFDVMYTFARSRKNRIPLTIHIPTNDNAVYKMCHAVLQNCTWITETVTGTGV